MHDDPSQVLQVLPVLLLPGWQNSGPRHWQSRWESVHGYQRVEQADWLWPRRGDWMAQLEEAVLRSARPVLLVAHSLGCHLAAGWAAHSGHTDRVKAALLVAPPDFERPDMPPQLHNWRGLVRQRLPFPAVVVLSDDDPHCTLEAGEALARDWGARTVHASSLVTQGRPADPPLGHLNADSGLADWPECHALLRSIASAVSTSTLSDTP